MPVMSYTSSELDGFMIDEAKMSSRSLSIAFFFSRLHGITRVTNAAERHMPWGGLQHRGVEQLRKLNLAGERCCCLDVLCL
jgi:hypothetical protein